MIDEGNASVIDTVPNHGVVWVDLIPDEILYAILIDYLCIYRIRSAHSDGADRIINTWNAALKQHQTTHVLSLTDFMMASRVCRRWRGIVLDEVSKSNLVSIEPSMHGRSGVSVFLDDPSYLVPDCVYHGRISLLLKMTVEKASPPTKGQLSTKATHLFVTAIQKGRDPTTAIQILKTSPYSKLRVWYDHKKHRTHDYIARAVLANGTVSDVEIMLATETVEDSRASRFDQAFFYALDTERIDIAQWVLENMEPKNHSLLMTEEEVERTILNLTKSGKTRSLRYFTGPLFKGVQNRARSIVHTRMIGDVICRVLRSKSLEMLEYWLAMLTNCGGNSSHKGINDPLYKALVLISRKVVRSTNSYLLGKCSLVFIKRFLGAFKFDPIMEHFCRSIFTSGDLVKMRWAVESYFGVSKITTFDWGDYSPMWASVFKRSGSFSAFRYLIETLGPPTKQTFSSALTDSLLTHRIDAEIVDQFFSLYDFNDDDRENGFLKTSNLCVEVRSWGCIKALNPCMTPQLNWMFKTFPAITLEDDVFVAIMLRNKIWLLELFLAAKLKSHPDFEIIPGFHEPFVCYITFGEYKRLHYQTKKWLADNKIRLFLKYCKYLEWEIPGEHEKHLLRNRTKGFKTPTIFIPYNSVVLAYDRNLYAAFSTKFPKLDCGEIKYITYNSNNIVIQ